MAVSESSVYSRLRTLASHSFLDEHLEVSTHVSAVENVMECNNTIFNGIAVSLFLLHIGQWRVGDCLRTFLQKQTAV